MSIKKLIWKNKCTRIAKKIFKNACKGDHVLPGIKLFHKPNNKPGNKNNMIFKQKNPKNKYNGLRVQGRTCVYIGKLAVIESTIKLYEHLMPLKKNSH